LISDQHTQVNKPDEVIHKIVMNNILKQIAAQGKRILIASIIGLSLWSMSIPAYAVDYQKSDHGIQATERYDQIQDETGGMNNFADTNPRRNTTQADTKAHELSDTRFYD